MSEYREMAKVMRDIANHEYVRLNDGMVTVTREMWLSIANIIEQVEKPMIRDCFQPPREEAWQRRLRLEYKQVRKRYDILCKTINQYENGLLPYHMDMNLAVNQRRAMGMYLECLIKRMRASGMEV